jgi:hypothetical protein
LRRIVASRPPGRLAPQRLAWCPVPTPAAPTMAVAAGAPPTEPALAGDGPNGGGCARRPRTPLAHHHLAQINPWSRALNRGWRCTSPPQRTKLSSVGASSTIHRPSTKWKLPSSVCLSPLAAPGRWSRLCLCLWPASISTSALCQSVGRRLRTSSFPFVTSGR